MESRAFLTVFGAVPGRLALALERRLDQSNQARREATDRRHLAVYRRHADSMADAVDLVILGHIHPAIDDPGPPRLIVLGGWHDRASYLRVDEGGASFVVGSETPTGIEATPGATGSREVST